MISFQNIYKKYGSQEVLKGINLKISEPGVYTILGPNGSGKTTLIKSFLGIVHLGGGQIFLNNKLVQGFEYRNSISYVPQIAKFPEHLTVQEFLDLIETLRGESQNRKELIRLFGIDQYLDKKINNLSGGMRQKVNLTGGLMFDTPVVIMDEPTIGLDPIALLQLNDWISKLKSEQKIILITTHVIDFVETMADEIIFMLEGNICYKGTYDELATQTHSTNLLQAMATLLKQSKDQTHV